VAEIDRCRGVIPGRNDDEHAGIILVQADVLEGDGVGHITEAVRSQAATKNFSIFQYFDEQAGPTLVGAFAGTPLSPSDEMTHEDSLMPGDDEIQPNVTPFDCKPRGAGAHRCASPARGRGRSSAARFLIRGIA